MKKIQKNSNIVNKFLNKLVSFKKKVEKRQPIKDYVTPLISNI